MTDHATCPKCRRWYRPGQEADPCLGMLEGVLGACCGHGNDKIAYVAFTNGVVLRPVHVERDTRIYRPPTPPE
jgi:hypothetical protein